MSTRVTIKDGRVIDSTAKPGPLRVLVAQDSPGEVDLPTDDGSVRVRIRQISAVDGADSPAAA